MALFHFTVTQTKRSKGQSAIASAAYRSGEKLYSEYYGEYSDYTRKGGVICSDILLPPHALKEYADRQTLWNAVEKAERGKNAQLAYSFEISLQNEFSLEENIALAREFLFREFVSRGMTVDVSFHEKECEDGGTPNPHFHFLCPIRPMEQDGTWGIKQRREYVLDEEGKAEHADELKMFYAARRKLTGEFPDGKVDMKKLTDEYDELEQAHETTYGEFKAVRDDLHRLWKRMPSAELEKAVNERGISSRTMRTAKSRIGDRLVTEKDGTAWVCYLRD